jgi:Tol biopolymer transport system component
MRLMQGGISYVPIWTPDGRRIAFGTYRAGFVNIFWKLAGSNDAPEALLINRDERKFPASWSSDGSKLIYNTLNPQTGGDIWCLPIGEKPQPLHRTRFQEGQARLSPDGRWLAYVSNESGQKEVYVRSFLGQEKVMPISTGGGSEPVWSHSGRELFYRNGNRMMAVDIIALSEFKPGKPRILFEGADAFDDNSLIIGVGYDISVDDQRFLMIVSEGHGATTTQINVVVNWFEELKRLVPSGKN